MSIKENQETEKKNELIKQTNFNLKEQLKIIAKQVETAIENKKNNSTFHSQKQIQYDIQKTSNFNYKINEYKNATISNLAVDLVEADDIYYLNVAIPGITKDDVEIEAGDNDIIITATFKPFIEELGFNLEPEDEEEADDVRVIASELTVGKCSKTVRFENSIDVEKISAKYKSGIVLITIPKLIIPKHKVTVE